MRTNKEKVLNKEPYLKSMQHLLGSLVPPSLLLVLVSTLSFALLYKSNHYHLVIIDLPQLK